MKIGNFYIKCIYKICKNQRIMKNKDILKSYESKKCKINKNTECLQLIKCELMKSSKN